MSEDEWYDRGEDLLYKWGLDNAPYLLTSTEESAFEYAWELAGREMGIVE